LNKPSQGNAGAGAESLCRMMDVMKQVSATVAENFLILVNLSQYSFYEFSATFAENLEIAEVGDEESASAAIMRFKTS
jgi:hypothetical protein